ncbi:uncharacterized protein FFNC_11360 [Fusarium fujikuroi]|nr:uncharacterized protein FFM5_13905 [Fusarium fujikuroi]SCO47294.1 uncharacterized protein FFNC_11360 [Fusarium fujikuroi]
MLFNREY